MKKIKLLMPLLGIPFIASTAISLVGCGNNNKPAEIKSISLTNSSESKGTITLINSGENNPELKYSINGSDWNIYSEPIVLEKGQTLKLFGNNPNGFSKSNNNYSTIKISTKSGETGKASISIEGSVATLINNSTTLPCDYCFYSLFQGSDAIVSVSENFLPYTELTERCYQSMFKKCSNLASTPKLPANTLKPYCYESMFAECSSITSAPVLAATTLANACYQYMFDKCTSLTNAGELPATKMAPLCYAYMFQNCSALRNAPALRSTELADQCYINMFAVSGIVAAPALPATTLTFMCYESMFADCTDLVQPPQLPATSITQTADQCYNNMFNGCSSLEIIEKTDTQTNADVKFFTYGSQMSGSFCVDMFTGCKSTESSFKTGTPTTGHSYYYNGIPTADISPRNCTGIFELTKVDDTHYKVISSVFTFNVRKDRYFSETKYPHTIALCNISNVTTSDSSKNPQFGTLTELDVHKQGEEGKKNIVGCSSSVSITTTSALAEGDWVACDFKITMSNQGTEICSSSMQLKFIYKNT